jgi:VWFA-related protein
VPGVERITVRLAQFDVVVRDQSGKTVSGLGPSDFKVFEDGSPLEIVAVDEWGRPNGPTASNEPPAGVTLPAPEVDSSSGASAGAVSPERRSFVIVFDALGETTALRMNQAKRAATDFVRSRLKPGDQGAVYQLDLSLRAVSGITADHDALVRGIGKIAWMPASSLADQVNESVLAYTNQANQGYQQQRLQEQSANVAGQLDWQREHVYETLTDLAAIFQGMPGKRVLVLASPGFPMTTTSDQRFQLGGFTPKFQKLIKTLATYGVTVYSLDIGSELTAGDAGQAIDWRIAVGKLGLDENVLSDLGLERTLGTNSASSRRQFLGVIAAETGGRMLTDTDLDRSFQALDEESSRFYRISCRVPVTTDTNRYLSFKVTVDRDGLTVASRRGRYSDVTPFEREPAAESATAVESLAGYKRLATQGIAVPLPAAASPKIPVTVVIEALGPVDIPADSQGTGKVDLDVRIVARAADEVVARYERGITATLKKGIEAVRAGFRVEGRLELVPGIYEIQGTIRLAAPAQVGTWTGIVAVPPPPKLAVPAIIGPLLSSDGNSAAPLLSQPPLQEAIDPLSVKPGVRFLPAPSSDFVTGQSLLTLFWLKDFAPPGDKPPAIDVAVRVLDSGGGPVTAPSQLVYFGPSAAGGFSVIARLDCSRLPSGTYLVQVSATPPDQKVAVSRRSAPFTLRARDVPLGVSASTSSSAP